MNTEYPRVFITRETTESTESLMERFHEMHRGSQRTLDPDDLQMLSTPTHNLWGNLGSTAIKALEDSIYSRAVQDLAATSDRFQEQFISTAGWVSETLPLLPRTGKSVVSYDILEKLVDNKILNIRRSKNPGPRFQKFLHLNMWDEVSRDLMYGFRKPYPIHRQTNLGECVRFLMGQPETITPDSPITITIKPKSVFDDWGNKTSVIELKTRKPFSDVNSKQAEWYRKLSHKK